MESRGKLSGSGRTVIESPIKPDRSKVKIRNDSGARTIVPSVGGQRILFEIGQIIAVDRRDVEFLLSLRAGENCVGCSGAASAPLFSLVEG